MKKFKVLVEKAEFFKQEIEVEAENRLKAKEIAQQKIDNYDIQDDFWEYSESEVYPAHFEEIKQDPYYIQKLKET
jgi:hypothetical protein